MLERFVGQRLIVRSHMAGCFAGVVESVGIAPDGQATVILQGSRQLWRWWAAEGVGLAGVAEHGLHPGHIESVYIGAKRSTPQTILGVCQIDVCTPEAWETIYAQPARQA